QTGPERGGLCLVPCRRGDFRGLARSEASSEEERGSLARRAPHPDEAAHGLHKLLRNRESQAGAAILARDRGIGLRKALKHIRELIFRDSDPCVVNRKPHHPSVRSVRLRLHFKPYTALMGKLEGVSEQVQ